MRRIGVPRAETASPYALTRSDCARITHLKVKGETRQALAPRDLEKTHEVGNGREEPVQFQDYQSLRPPHIEIR